MERLAGYMAEINPEDKPKIDNLIQYTKARKEGDYSGAEELLIEARDEGWIKEKTYKKARRNILKKKTVDFLKFWE